MPDAPEGGHGMLHADDTLVLAGGRRWYEILNQMLGLSVSPAKSEAMWFGRRYRGALPPGMSVNINGEEVPGRCQMNYLGLIIDSQWTFRPHFEILVPRVTAKALKEVRRRTRATTTTRSSEGRDTRQQRTTEGDQPSILNWL